jgi:hypothetical protein
MEKISEAALQQQCFTWVWNTYPELRYTFFSIPNEGAQSIRFAARLKATGRVAGAPDMIFLLPHKMLLVEFKAKGGTLSQEQFKVHVALAKNGYEVHVVNDFLQFQVLFIQNYKPKPLI